MLVLTDRLCSLSGKSRLYHQESQGDPGVYAAIGSDSGEAGGDPGFIVGENGVVVVDSFEDVAIAQNLLRKSRN